MDRDKIWMPDVHSGTEAVTNALDLLLRAQRRIDTIDDPLEWDEEMHKYFEIINELFEQKIDALHDVAIGSKIAFLELDTIQDIATTETESGLLTLAADTLIPETQPHFKMVEQIRVVGDVQRLSYLQLGERATGYALDVDAHLLLKTNPSGIDNITPHPARIPIQAVKYVEFSHAAA